MQFKIENGQSKPKGLGLAAGKLMGDIGHNAKSDGDGCDLNQLKRGEMKAYSVFGMHGCKGIRKGAAPTEGHKTRNLFPFFLTVLTMYVREDVGRSQAFVCLWRPEVKLCCCSSRVIHLISSETVTHLAWNLLMRLPGRLTLMALLLLPLQP